MLLVIGLAQFALLFVISFSMIASAVCGLVGPLFVPFFIVPTLEWLFWGWLKAFIQYSFMLVIANAFIFVFERFLSRYLQTLPPGLRLEDQLLYGVHAVMILVTFTVGVLLVPSLTSSIFSGRSGESDAAGSRSASRREVDHEDLSVSERARQRARHATRRFDSSP